MPRPHRRSAVQRIKERLASLGYRGKVLRKAWCLHALTESEAEQLKRSRGIYRVKVLPMGIDICTAEQEPDTGAAAVCPGKRMVLYLGPLHPGEGLVPLLKAAALVADKFEDLRLVLAGAEQPRWTEMIRAAVRRQGFEDRVTLLPSPDPEQMQRLLREMILLVAPVPGECCPVAPLQALAGGKPVIISPGCNLPEVELGKAGWIVKPKRRELQSVLHEAFSRAPGDLEEMGRRGARIIEERYTWDRIGHEYLNLYARILG
ncbi:MAG: glycosyltransferase family 4 protein [Planctomycetes bacterium]|nr:glycosyltransferase family 4 protein [Planctomycetota bacterium]